VSSKEAHTARRDVDKTIRREKAKIERDRSRPTLLCGYLRGMTLGMIVGPQVLGVICLREFAQRRDVVLDELIARGQCVVLLDEVAPGHIQTIRRLPSTSSTSS